MENKDFYKKIYVIIQGPVLSKGRNFKTSIQILTKEFNSDEELVVPFNSSQTIIENSEQLIKKGINVIYSGWEKECPETIKQKGTDMLHSKTLGNKSPTPDDSGEQ